MLLSCTCLQKDNKHKTFHFPEEIIIANTEGGKGKRSFKTQAHARIKNDQAGGDIHLTS